MTLLDSFRAGGDGRRCARRQRDRLRPALGAAALAEAQLAESAAQLREPADWPLSLICLYDSRRLDRGRVDRDAPQPPGDPRRGQRQRRLRRQDLADELFATPLPRPDAAGCVSRRRRRPAADRDRAPSCGRWPAATASPPDRVDDLVLAANEIVHEQPAPRRRPVHGDDVVGRRVGALRGARTAATSRDPLLGRLAPQPASASGRGLWLANHLCDLVQIRSSHERHRRPAVDRSAAAELVAAHGAFRSLVDVVEQLTGTRREVVAGGHVLAYQEAGPPDGPVVVLLHGLASDSDTWDRALGPLAARGLRVLALDLFGPRTFGQAGRPVPARRLRRLAARVPRRAGRAGGDAVRPLPRRGDRGALRGRPPRPGAALVLVSAGGLGREVHPVLRAAALPFAPAVLGLALRPRLRRCYARPRLHRALRLTPDNLTNLRRAGRALAPTRRPGRLLRLAARGHRAGRPARIVHRDAEARRARADDAGLERAATRSSRWRTPAPRARAPAGQRAGRLRRAAGTNRTGATPSGSPTRWRRSSSRPSEMRRASLMVRSRARLCGCPTGGAGRCWRSARSRRPRPAASSTASRCSCRRCARAG